MNKDNKTSLKDAVINAIKEENRLSHNDLKFLLLKNGSPKRYFKDRKKRYKQWEQKYKNQGQRKGGFPFRSCDAFPSYLSQILKELQKKGRIKKINGKYELVNTYKIEAIRSKDKIVIDHYKVSDIYEHNGSHFIHKSPYNIEPILRVYGLNPEVLKHAKKIGLKEKLLSQFDKLEEVAYDTSTLKDEIGEKYKEWSFLQKIKQLNDIKILKFAKKYYELFIFLLNNMDSFLVEKNEKKNEMNWVIDKIKLEYALNNIKIYPAEKPDIFILKHKGVVECRILNTDSNLPKKGREIKELNPMQIKKIVNILIKSEKKYQELYGSHLFPSFFINECPSKKKSEIPFIYFKPVSRPLKLSEKINKKLGQTKIYTLKSMKD